MKADVSFITNYLICRPEREISAKERSLSISCPVEDDVKYTLTQVRLQPSYGTRILPAEAIPREADKMHNPLPILSLAK